jgi:hypothetical protein
VSAAGFSDALLSLARFNPESHRGLLTLTQFVAKRTQRDFPAATVNTRGFGGESCDLTLSTRLDCDGHLASCLSVWL